VTGLWSAATSTASLYKRCRPLFTGGGCASIKAKAGASSGAVAVDTIVEKLDAAGKLGVSSGLFKPAR
jgi:hypothetical protein